MMRRGRDTTDAVSQASEAAAAAVEAVEAASKHSDRVLMSLKHGAYVTLAFVLVYYAFLLAQANMKRKLRAHYMEQGKRFERYACKDKKMLAWDRTVGNMLEQSMPFLALFWMSVFFSTSGGLSVRYVVTLGWIYVGLRIAYPLMWFSGGGGPSGTTSIIWRVTIPMYLINIFLAVNVLCAAAFRGD